jgi:glycosyltransferase involved in cell wall biosynthesis
MPYAVLEAMSCGLPIIATRVGGIPEIIDNGRNGLLVPPNDVKKLAESMLAIATDSGLRERLSKAARMTTTHRYSIESMVQQTREAFAAAAGGVP